MATPSYAPQEAREFALDVDACLDLLARCGAASLACTDKALPCVLFVTVSVTSSTIRLAVARGADVDRLEGQIVALDGRALAASSIGGW